MKRLISASLCLSCLLSSTVAQTPFEYGKYGNKWWAVSDIVNLNNMMLIGFENSMISESLLQNPNNIDLTCSRHSSFICNKNGLPLFYSNERSLYNYTGGQIENGDSLNPQLNYSDWHQAQLALPYPGQDGTYILFNQHRYINYAHGAAEIDGLSYSLIDMTQNNDLGKVTLKNEPLIQDSLQYGGLVTCRHANGRDWWVIQPRARGRIYYRYLLTPQGVITYPPLEFTEGYNIPNTIGLFGNSTFSPDGTKYARLYDTYTITGINGLRLEVHDFDRCTGEFTNFTEQYIQTTGQTFSTANCTFSPNSEYLYITDIYHVMRKRVDNIMGNLDTLVALNWHPTDSTYNILQAANTGVDGRFYFAENILISHDGGITNHVIGSISILDNPDSEMPIFYEQIIPISSSIGLLPYTTNFRLGPADGTACDTLGIDAVNIPWEVINLPLGVEEIGLIDDAQFSLKPNPAQHLVELSYSVSDASIDNIQVVTVLGQTVFEANNLFGTQMTINTSNWDNGLYIIMLRDSNGKISTQKLVIQH